MNARGRRWFHAIATDRTVNQTANMPPIQSGFFQSGSGRLNAHGTRQSSRLEPPPFADSRHQLQPAGGKSQPLIDWSQPSFNIVGRNHTRRERMSDCGNADVVVPHRRSRSRRSSGCPCALSARHRARPGGLATCALLAQEQTSAKGVEPPGQARWRCVQSLLLQQHVDALLI